MKGTLKEAFSLSAVVLGGAGSLLFGIGTVTEAAQASIMVVPVAAAFTASAGLLYVGIRGLRKIAAEKERPPQQKPDDPSP